VSFKVINQVLIISYLSRVVILRDAARAMVYLHSKQKMHRDLKSPNLLLAADGKTKVCDFGLARPRPQGEKETGELSFKVGTIEVYSLDFNCSSTKTILCSLSAAVVSTGDQPGPTL